MHCQFLRVNTRMSKTETIKQLAQENTFLRARILDVVTGHADVQSLTDAIDLDSDSDPTQYTTALWWFSKNDAPKVVTPSQVETPSPQPPQSLVKDKYDVDNVRRVFDRKGYEFDNLINIFGVRSNDHTPNVFNDEIVVVHCVDGEWKTFASPATTDPGARWLSGKPLNAAGTAILVPGQYKSKYTIRKHRNEYDAVCQKWGTSVKVYRDDDRDGRLDFDCPVGNAGGINIHRADKYKTIYSIGAYSAGCQVFQNPKHFDQFMAICHKAAKSNGNSFTYTLLTESDF